MGTFRCPNYDIVIVENNKERSLSYIGLEKLLKDNRKSWTQAHGSEIYRELCGFGEGTPNKLYYGTGSYDKWEKHMDEFDYEWKNHKLYIYVKEV